MDGPDGSLEIRDDGNTGHVVTEQGTAALTTGQKKLGSSAVVLDGNSDYLSIPDSADWNFASTDFAIELWARWDAIPTTTNQVLYHQRVDGNNAVRFVYRALGSTESNFLFDVFTAGSQVIDISTDLGAVSTNLNTGTWYHLAVSRSANDFRLFVDGVIVASTSTSAAVPNLATQVLLGGNPDISAFMTGHLDEVRVSKGASRHNANFTPQTTEYTSDAQTVLLLHLDSRDVSGDGGSDEYNIPDFQGTAQIDTATSKFGGAALLLDGNSDYLHIPDSTDWDTILASSTQGCTIDFWVNPSTTNIGSLIGQHVDGNNEWRLFMAGAGVFRFFADTGGSNVIDTTGGTVAITTWQHVALIRSADNFGVYIDGTQVSHASTAPIGGMASPFEIGVIGGTSNYVNGSIDEFRYQNSNYFNANPTAANTDSITVPTEAYSTAVDGGGEMNPNTFYWGA
jgi:hypothetical protein